MPPSSAAFAPIGSLLWSPPSAPAWPPFLLPQSPPLTIAEAFAVPRTPRPVISPLFPDDSFATSGINNRFTQAEVDAMEEGVASVLTAIENQLADQVLAETLPFIGPNLRTAWENNVASLRFLTALRTHIAAALATFNGQPDYDPAAVATAIRNRITTQAGFPAATVSVTAATLNDQAQLSFAVSRSLSGNTPIAPDLGLPNLEVQISGSPVALTTASPALSFTIGVDPAGFYLDTAGASFQLDTTTIHYYALNAPGTFAGLPVTFTRNDSANRTQIPANFAVTLKDPNNDGRLRPAEAEAPGADLLDATLTGNTLTSIKIASSIDPSIMLPRGGTDLVLHWNFSNVPVDPTDDNSTFGSRPLLTLENNRLNLDSFFNSFAGRVLGQIETVTRPLRPVTDVLTAEIPLLSDLSSDRVTILDILGVDATSVAAIGGIDALLDLAELASSFSVAPQTTIDLGTWSFPSGDLRMDRLDDLTGSASRPPSPHLWQVNSFINQANTIPGLSFPILTDQYSVVALLLGREADLFSWRSGEFGFSTSFQQYFPVLGPLGITLGGEVGLQTQLGFGYDTRGLIDYRTAAVPDTSLFFNGFYAMALDEGGAPLTGITLSAGITAGIELNLLLASAGVEGDLTATVGIYLDDMLGDEFGRVRGDIFSTLDMDEWFYAAGSLSAGLRAYVEIGWPPFGLEFDFESPRVILINFDSRNPNRPILAGVDLLDPGALHLNVGDRAHLRTHGDTDDRAEEFLIRKRHYSDIVSDDAYEEYSLDDLGDFHVTDEILVVEGFNTLRLYPVPSRIVGHGKLRGDLLSVHEDTHIPVHFTGGDGRDILRGGSAADTLEGGDGPDLLNGRGGNNTLRGGPGNDELISGDGANTLDGGDGEDTASWLGASIPLVMDLRTGHFAGAAAGDTLISIERYKGTSHEDTMDGSEGNDFLNGLSGNDTIRGHGGDDQLEGGSGDDQLFGGGGNDYLSGGPGADHLDGGPGIDIASYLGAESPVTASLETGIGTRGDALGDTLTGIEILMGSGLPKEIPTPNFSGDILEGGPGNDIIYGMAGNDTLRGGGGNDILYGHHPDISTFTPEGYDDDKLYGGPGNDTLHGQSGDDELDGEAGSDTLHGGPGNDHLITFDLQNSDHLDGNEGYDRLSADYSDKTAPLHFTVGGDNSHIFPDGDQFHNIQTLGTLRTGPGDDVIRLSPGAEPAYHSKNIDAGPGDDLVIADWRGFHPGTTLRTADRIHGGEGNDTISFEQSISPVHIELFRENQAAGSFGQNAAAEMTVTGFENVIGTHGADRLAGDDGDNIFTPLPNTNGLTWAVNNNHDIVVGGGGIDTLRMDFSQSDLFSTEGIWMYPHLSPGPSTSISLAVSLRQLVACSQVERLEITGTAAKDWMYGLYTYTADDRFIGLGGDDYIDARAGNDYLDGGEGDDTLLAGTGNDTVIGGPGNDTIVFLASGDLQPLTPYGHDICDAGPGDDIVTNIRSPGADSTYADHTTIFQFDGGPGFDALSIDLGHLTGPLVVDEAHSINFNLPNGGYIRNFEAFRDLTTGDGNDVITLRGRHNAPRRISLRGGDDTLVATLGVIDALGGAGDDLLIVDYSEMDDADTGGVVREGAYHVRRRLGTGEVLDQIRANNFERVHFTGTSKNDTFISPGAFSGDAVMYGAGGDDALYSSNGNDRLYGGPGNDYLEARDGNDWLDGGEGNDTLSGGPGNDWLDGGPGADTMDGSGGNDTFIVNDPGDIVIDYNTEAGGIDTVRSSIDYTLPANVENLVLTGNAIQGTGNSQGNRLTGNTRPNHLRGEVGNDTLDGGGGNKIDRLHGGPGADTFILGSAGVRYYDEGNPASPGHGGYALIEDFTPTASPSTTDRLQLAGSAAEYLLGESPFEDIEGTALYHDSNGNGELDPAADELIAILQSAVALTPANTTGNAIRTQPLDPAAIGLTAPLKALLIDDPLGRRFAAEFEIDAVLPASARLEIQTSTDLGIEDPWLTIASKTGPAAWTGLVPVTTEDLGNGKVKLTIPALHSVALHPKLFLRLVLSE